LERHFPKKWANPPQNFRTATLKRPKIGDEDFWKKLFLNLFYDFDDFDQRTLE
jgi:hypothetical protein